MTEPHTSTCSVYHVLIVEDNDVEAEGTRRALNKSAVQHRFEVSVARDMNSVREFLDRRLPDVVLLDLGLPDSSGLESLHALSEVAPDVPVVVLTGQNEGYIGEQAIRDGAHDFLVKGEVHAGTLARSLSYAIEREISRRAQRKAQREAEAADRSKSVLLAMMSHDVRSPMASVIGYTDLLLEEPTLSDVHRKYVETVAENSAQVMNLLDDMLAFSHADARGVELSEEIIELPAFLHSVIGTAMPAALKRGLDLRHELASDLPERVWADPDRLRQILLNLVGNASKYTETGHVILRAERCEDVARGLCFVVEDTGLGIPEEEQEQIFEAFFRSAAAEHRARPGTGLGLTIVKQLVASMGGEIRLESEVGVGTRVYVDLPLRDATLPSIAGEADLSASAPPSGQDEDATGEQEDALKILVVDDDADTAMLIRALVRLHSEHVQVVMSGQEALACVQEEAFDVVLMDLAMPVMDGLETACAIRDLDLPAQPAIVAVTVRTTPGVEEACKNADMDGYVRKPFSGAGLWKAIQDALRSQSASS